MIRVKNVKRTCHACPSQWEGTTDDGKPVYARYRWGFLRVEVNSEVVFGERIGKEARQEDDATITQMRSSTEAMRKLCVEIGETLSFDGHLCYESLCKATEGVISWPDQED